MNKRGFTLMELVVYMAILGVVVIVAGQAFSNSTKHGMKSKSMLVANQVAEDVGILIRDDIAQMGVKSFVEEGDADAFDNKFSLHSKVYMNENTDKSSFKYEHNKNGIGRDVLSFRRIKVKEDGSFYRVEEIEWGLDASRTLYRSCQTIEGTADSLECPKTTKTRVSLAENVEKFVLTPSKPDSDIGESTIFPLAAEQGKFKLIPRTDPSKGLLTVSKNPAVAAQAITLSGFSTNYSPDGNGGSVTAYHQVFVGSTSSSDASWTSAAKFNFLKDQTYELRFKMPYNEDASRMFRPNKDHMTVGFKKVDDGGVIDCRNIPETFIFPPETEDGEATHVIRFTPQENVTNAMLAFTFAFYSPTVGGGSLTIRDVEVRSVTDERFKFDKDYVPNTSAEKMKVRAFKMELHVLRNGADGKVEMVIPVPSNGTVEL